MQSTYIDTRFLIKKLICLAQVIVLVNFDPDFTRQIDNGLGIVLIFFVNCIDDDGCEKWEGAKIFQIPKFFLHFGLGKKFTSKSHFYGLKYM